MKTSKRLVIFEGPDGVGKTTLAKAWAKAHGALYVHLGPFKGMKNIARLYVEAMLPAVLGVADVAMDRCWISEPIYGAAFRNGEDRVGIAATRMLERLAYRCETTVVRCLAPLDRIIDGFRARKGEEYLETEEQLEAVFDSYATAFHTALPTTTVAPLSNPVSTMFGVLDDGIASARSVSHLTYARTAGNLLGSALIVGEAAGALKDGDPLYQWPFGSFHEDGCSAWLARRLEAAGIGEERLCWVNADQLTPNVARVTFPAIVALGGVARDRLISFGRDPDYTVPHPQRWKRFHHNEEYPLINVLKGVLGCLNQ